MDHLLLGTAANKVHDLPDEFIGGDIKRAGEMIAEQTMEQAWGRNQE